MDLILFLAVHGLLSFAVAHAAERKGRSASGFFWLSVITSALIGYIVLQCVGRRYTDAARHEVFQPEREGLSIGAAALIFATVSAIAIGTTWYQQAREEGEREEKTAAALSASAADRADSAAVRALEDSQAQFQRVALGEKKMQQRAVERFPMLSVKGSPLNREFVDRYQRYRAKNPAFFHDHDWPVRLAQESEAALIGKR